MPGRKISAEALIFFTINSIDCCDGSIQKRSKNDIMNLIVVGNRAVTKIVIEIQEGNKRN